jgi:hypothetical protein
MFVSSRSVSICLIKFCYYIIFNWNIKHVLLGKMYSFCKIWEDKNICKIFPKFMSGLF